MSINAIMAELAQYTRLQEEAAAMVEALKDQIKEYMTAAGLEVLTDDERKVLDRFYINPARGNVDRLCEEFGIEKSQVYARKDSALHHFTICLYGCAEI